MIKIIFTLLTFIFLQNFAIAASFDCSKELLEAEKMVCSNSELSLMDEKLAELYFSVKQRAADHEQIKADQIKWIGALRKCADVPCMKATYQARFIQLSARNRPEGSRSDSTEDKYRQTEILEATKVNQINQQLPDSTPPQFEGKNAVEINTSAVKSSGINKTESNEQVYTPVLSTGNSGTGFNWGIPSDVIFVFNMVLLISIFIAPIAPAIILESKIDKESDIVFVHYSEMLTYLISGVVVIFGIFLFYVTHSIPMKIVSGLVLASGVGILLSLYGFQKLTTSKDESIFTLYFLKILFIGFGSLIVLIFYFIASIFAHLAYDSAKKRQVAETVVNASIGLGAYKAGEKSGKTFFGKDSKYINGPAFSDISAIFPDNGIKDVIATGWTNFKAGKNATRLDSLLDQFNVKHQGLQPSNRF